MRGVQVIPALLAAVALLGPAQVTCQSDLEGAFTIGTRVVVPERVCRDLSDPLNAFLFAHELSHARGELREGWADCQALKTMRVVLRVAGVRDSARVARGFLVSGGSSYTLPVGCPVHWGG